MKRYTVEQSFEGLGDPCKTVCLSLADAETQAAKLLREIADMVEPMCTPAHYDAQPTGYVREIEAWELALETAGVRYDEDGDRTPDSPETYGREAAEEIAAEAVVISEIE